MNSSMDSRACSSYINLEDHLAGKSESALHTYAKLTAIWALLSVVAVMVTGCSLGPINLGDSPTPAAQNGTPAARPTDAARPPTSTPAQMSLTGKVVDAYTGQGIASAQITAGGILTETTTTGAFSFDALPLGAKINAMADG